MNYKKIYEDIITNAKIQNRIKNAGIYYELHHIKPKSLFPELKSEKDNLVLLTGREHFICHLLLVKIYNSSQMWYAINMMINLPKTRNKKDRYYPKLTARTYAIIRENFSKCVSVNNTGKMAGDKNPFYGKKHSEETKLLISKTHKKENLQKSTTDLMRKNNTGTGNPFFKTINTKEDIHVTEGCNSNHPIWRFRKPACGISIGRSKNKYTKEQFIDYVWELLQKATYKTYEQDNSKKT